jgi:hypothetical protein
VYEISSYVLAANQKRFCTLLALGEIEISSGSKNLYFDKSHIVETCLHYVACSIELGS